MHQGLEHRRTVAEGMSMEELTEGANAFKPRAGLSPRSRAAWIAEQKADAAKERQDEIARRIAAKSPHRRGEERFPAHFWPALEEAVAGVHPSEFSIKGQLVATYSGEAAQPRRKSV